MNSWPSFSGYQDFSFKQPRTYRIYVTPDYLCGAYLAGFIFNQRSADAMFQYHSGLFRRFTNNLINRRKLREAHYDEINPLEYHFLTEDKRNFHIKRQEVVSIVVDRAGAIFIPDCSGTVRIELSNGEMRKYHLVGNQNPDSVAEILKEFAPETTVVGNPGIFTVRPTRDDWIGYAVLAFIFFPLGLLCSYLNPNIHPLSLYGIFGALFYSLTIAFVWEAYKHRKLPASGKDQKRVSELDDS